MVNARVVASGWYVPDEVLDNDFFVKSPNNPYLVHIGEDEDGNPLFRDERFQQTAEGIIETTGIEQRRRIGGKETLVDMIVRAYEKTMFPAKELEGIFVATVSDEQRFPSLASRTQKAIGARGKIGYAGDVVAACSGFTHAMDHARLKVQESGGYFLVAGVESLTRMTDYTERNCILFGDGCGLVVVGPSEDEEHGILGTYYVNDCSGVNLIYKDPRGKLRMPDGGKVFKSAVRGMVDVAHGAMERAGITKGMVDFYVPHQANERIIAGVEHVVDPSVTGKVIRNIRLFGNMSSATEPTAYAMAREEGKIKEGHVVVWTDIASGFSCGSIVERV